MSPTLIKKILRLSGHTANCLHKFRKLLPSMLYRNSYIWYFSILSIEGQQIAHCHSSDYGLWGQSDFI